MQNEHDIAAMAAWVTQHRGCDARRYVAEQIARLSNTGCEESLRLWRAVDTQMALPPTQIIPA
jgi:hypothetical protein